MEVLTQGLLCSVFFIALAILFRIVTKRGSSSQLPLPPGPRPLPVLGNILELGQNPHRSLARLARTYGPVMSLKLGTIHTVVVSSPSFAKIVLKTKEHSISDRHVPDAVKILGHEEVSIVWLPPNQSWRYLRTLAKTHLFNSQSLEATQILRRKKVEELVAFIRGENGAAVHIARAAFSTVLNLISTTILSTDMVDFKSNSAQELKDTMWGLMEEAGRPNISDFFPLLAPIDMQGRRRRFTVYFKKLYDFFDQMIENRLAITAEGRRKNPDILDVLLQLCREVNSKLNRRMIKSLLLDFFLAGSETAAATLEWAMAELLHRPELMMRAREEITTVIGFEREVEESDISRLLFLQAVLKETLRLHPPVPLLLPHKAEVSTEINGYRVPKNNQVLVNVWAMGRDERVWENPDCFLPERFMEGNEIDFRGQHFELIPFGSGRRICPGLPLGVRMVQLMLASLIQSFEWSLPDGMKPTDLDLTEKFGVTLVLACPLKAIATPARKN
ncbi:geraniol 8-hydroxylase-like [Dendrobium catenatum]|uniref:Geraniol 8-hydroxylase-like protein n=2 Tax=Dendrobium TaxID=37818 RepID=A0A7T0BRY5_DENNO|nr:geraniol 8-hydroxylase-like [Dendrobium catenatum]PKU83147.1 Geraniol 8-hydroxylase [Dendrobium catenatum]QPJ58150.1 geraniol 8-hydroxylase-like protein [Dendrobium nobile]